MMIILYSVLVLVLSALMLGIVIVLISNKLTVKEDPLLEKVISHLAGVNCGACGKAGCADFAKALINNTTTLSECNATKTADKKEILRALGSDEIISMPTVVVNACCGGNDCQDKYEYQGYGDCQSIEIISKGNKACTMGCIGKGNCIDVCLHGALYIDNGCAVVDQKKCVQCGLCILNCPKLIIRRISKNAVYYIACSSCYKGKDVKNKCKNGCIGCNLCAKNCPQNAITMKENLPVFDYEKCNACGICQQKCPSGCIKSLE